MKRDKYSAAIATIAGMGVALGVAAQIHAEPTPSSDDTPEEIANDSARDLKDNRLYNRPGATRASMTPIGRSVV